MFSLRSLPQFFRSLEWIFLTAHLGVLLSASSSNVPIVIGSCGMLFTLSWIFPQHRSQWQRCIYIALGIAVILGAGYFGINLGIFLQVYAAKTYFLLGQRWAIAFVGLTAIPWALNEYARSRLQVQPEAFNMDASDPIRFAIFTLAIYAASSFFTLMLSRMIVVQQKKDQKIAELSEQVESLGATLERSRIAREIHDSLGHTLTDLDMQLAVAQTLRSHNPTQAFEAVDTAKLLARQCIEDVSHALSRMRESNFDLDQALIALQEQLRQTTALRIDWKVNLPNLPTYQSYQIYCLIKEALMNVQKHAKATDIWVSIHPTEQGMAIALIDNGVGFDPTTYKPGFGIQGMMERVQLLGGQFDIQTAIAQGTQIHITLPL
jgi:signal transduction histidine kinase